jgi:diaminohydroxyphosphoribosylaminopyrimidine deaminase/5-amino-6-(5-phosphoribosylamino)uracil reductase
MALALEQARRGAGTTSPNPSVGAVVVKDGHVLASGHTTPVGGPHAEIVALRGAGEHARGADLYSTLEPCNHFGRTPPCTEAIVEAGIARVIIGSADPNPRVRGGGAEALRRAGVEVIDGVLRGPCDYHHANFFKHITTGMPLLTLKIASTLDGRLAASSGDSRWVTGEAARERVHQLRSQVDAVIIGAGTARADNPQLTARHVAGAHQPLRVVIEGRTPLPNSLELFRDRAAKTLLVTPQTPSRPRERALEKQDVETLVLSGKGGSVPLGRMLQALGERGITSALCEGGAALASALMRDGLVDRLMLFLAPKLLGAGKSWLELAPTRHMAEAWSLADLQVELVGQDLLLQAELPRAQGSQGSHKVLAL